LISKTGRNRGPLDHPFGVMMAAGLRPRIRLESSPVGDGIGFRTGVDSARRDAPVCAARGRDHWDRRYDRYGVGGRAKPVEPGSPAPLGELRQAVPLPPMGSATAQTRTAMTRLCAEKVIAVPDRREPPAVVV
jgi:hypothetical protein